MDSAGASIPCPQDFCILPAAQGERVILPPFFIVGAFENTSAIDLGRQGSEVGAFRHARVAAGFRRVRVDRHGPDFLLPPNVR